MRAAGSSTAAAPPRRRLDTSACGARDAMSWVFSFALATLGAALALAVLVIACA